MPSVAPRVLRFGELPVSRWRNGGGVTREVASAPADSDFDWRVSIADVDAPGPFSAFPGVDRVITLLDGDGMVLTVDGVEHRLIRHTPFAFAGEERTTCALTWGSTRDLNLMTRRGRAKGRLVVQELDGSAQIDLSGEDLAVALEGQITLTCGAARTELAPLDTVLQPGNRGQEAGLSGVGRPL